MKIALIVNPCAGGKNGEKQISPVEKKFAASGIDPDIFISRDSEHLVEIASSLSLERYDAILSMGGDGTNFHVLNGLLSAYKPDVIPPLGIIPIGSGNSFARDLNIHCVEEGIKAVVNHAPRRIDVCSYTQNGQPIYFVNLAGIGFVTDVAKTARHFKRLGDISYIIGVFYRTVSLHFHWMELEVDGTLISGENCFVEFCNSRYTGGNMLMAPTAEIDDGLMDIIIAGKLSRASLLATLPKIFKGTHIHHPALQSIKAKKAVIKTSPNKTLLPDGELWGSTPTTVQIHPKMIQYLS
jgi:YegS/Rv2252/BmrU family lipid kinase